MNQLKQEIVKTILYFDIFSFPLKEEEIFQFCQIPTQRPIIQQTLAELVTEGQLQQTGDHYAVRESKRLSSLRQKKFQLSTKLMTKAHRNAALISQFPFVRGVAISGSLSKYAADEAADIDFFIITAPDRLWICRSFLHLFKKLTFLVRRQHDFCMNYFLDQEELELKDKNLYTAFESISIIPVYGKASFKAFFTHNHWAREFFPNAYPEQKLAIELQERIGWLKRSIEFAFGVQWGRRINQRIRRSTVRWWREKFRRQGYQMDQFEKDLRATNGESKYHPNDYQHRILQAYQERLERFSSATTTSEVLKTSEVVVEKASGKN
ncbi:MAG: hypothetical protein KTR30_13250 [Saprospiraceae bacterium]|nr:hypothetical protein [Saprospiraceae bacterium]